MHGQNHIKPTADITDNEVFIGTFESNADKTFRIKTETVRSNMKLNEFIRQRNVQRNARHL